MPRYNPPPNWPTPPSGWTPPPDWKPDPAWGPAPAGWSLWVEDAPVARGSWFARHKILTGVGALALDGIVGSAIGGGGSDTSAPAVTGSSPTAAASAAAADGSAPAQKTKPSTTKQKASTEQADAAATLPGIGDAVTDGSFRFTVRKVSCGITKVGDAYLNEKAQGQFCIVSLRITNVGDDAATFSDSNQKLINGKKQEFSADTSAGIYLGNANAFLEEINPGNSVNGKIVFDIPKNAEPEIIELHDDRFFSGGVQVDLS